jgi:putative nucleotidyltransferase with HDIG domain
MADDRTSSRWQRRSAGARALRWAVLCAPVVASVTAAWAAHGQLPAVRGPVDRLWQLLVLGLVSTVVVVVVDRLARRLLPLVTLLDLSMLFPDRAPSRLAVARAAIRRRPIEEQLARVREAGADPGAVAREILTLVAALSAHDRPTRGHAERVRMFTDLLAEQLKVPRRDRDLLRWAAILHDIGKLQVPATLLNKPGKPTEQEWAVLKAHPAHGAEMAAGLLPWLGEWSAVIVQHHERYDGTGYPTGLGGARISLGARIVSVADAYDVMTAARAYKRPVSRAAALRELVRFSGTQFDPTVVRAMVAVGAPRLRRTQGLLAWLADLPLVASSAVPAATVARVVGASALVTGAVAGPAAFGLPGDPPPERAVLSAAASQGPGSPGGSARDTGSRPEASGAAADRSATAVSAGADPTATPVPTTSAPAATAPGPDPHPSTPTTTRDAGSTWDPSSGSPAPTASTSPAPKSTPTTGTLTGTVNDVVTDPVGTVDGVLQDPVGTVDDTVDTVTGTVDTVTGTVDTVTGTVTGTVGTLLGSGSSGSGSTSPNSGSGSTSPNSGPGSTSSGSGSDGLLGDLLGP